jgi:NADH-quinone oxidoreductase subunit H
MHSRKSPHADGGSSASPAAPPAAGVRSRACVTAVRATALGAGMALTCRPLLAAGVSPASAPLWSSSWPSLRPDFWTSAFASSGPDAWLASVLGSWGDAWPQLVEDVLLPLLLMLAKSLALIVVLLIAIAFLLLFDRKVWAAVQLRRGPNVVGPFGLLQSFADLLKFVLKEPLIPAGADKGVFLLAPLVTAVLALAAWAVIPLNANASGRWVISDLNVGVLYLFAISSLGVYGIIMGGWASNSKYPFLGALRSAAQMVSYEVSIGFVIITVLLTVGSLNMSDIVEAQHAGIGTRLGLVNSALDWNWLALLPMFVVFFISALAETNRPPFDLPEAESELVAGYAVEYSSAPYLLFMLGEYVSVTTMCALTTIMFLGGWLPPVDLWPLNQVPGLVWFVLKLVAVFFMFAMVKAFVPRYRYDQLMRLGWKVFLPLSLLMVVVVASVQYLLELAP